VSLFVGLRALDRRSYAIDYKRVNDDQKKAVPDLQKTVAFCRGISYYWNQAGEDKTPTKARLTS
jgi:hypothetical protein